MRLTSEILDANGSLTYFPPAADQPTATTSVDSGDDVRRKRDVDECLSERLEGVAQQINIAAVIKASVESSKTTSLAFYCLRNKLRKVGFYLRH